jgi:hypothetical protein
VLVAIGSFVYLRFRTGLDSSIDQGLRTRAGDVTALVQQADSGLTQSGAGLLTTRGESLAQILTSAGRIFDSTPLIRAAPILDPTQLDRALNGSVLLQINPPWTGLNTRAAVRHTRSRPGTPAGGRRRGLAQRPHRGSHRA